MPSLIERVSSAGKRELQTRWSTQIDDYATCLSYSADGMVVAVGSASGKVWIQDARTGQTIRTLDAHSSGVLGLSFSPKKRVLCTGGQDGMARLFDVDEGRVIAELPGKAAWVDHVAFSPDGNWVATSSGKFVRLWSHAGVPALETEAHESTVSAVSWSRKGDAFVTCCYGGVHIFRMKANVKTRHLAWKGSLISLAQSPDGRVIACGSQDCSVHFWRLPSGADSFMEGFASKPKSLAFSANSRYLATTGEPIISIWDFAGKGPEGTQPIMLSGHVGLVTQLVFQTRGTTLVSGAEDSGILVWDPRIGEEPLGYGFLEESVSSIVIHPHDEAFTAADAAGNVHCFALPSSQIEKH